MSAEIENPGNQWLAGLNALGDGTVTLAQNVVPVKETKRVDWENLRNLALFRYRCGKFPFPTLLRVMIEVKPNIPEGIEDAGMMDKDIAEEEGEDTVSEASKIAESDVEMLDEGVTEPEDG